MNPRETTRRRVLRGIGTGLVAGAVGVTGCVGDGSTGTSPPDDTGTGGTTTTTTSETTASTTSETTTTTTGEQSYPSRRWIPSPGAITEVSSFAVGQRAPAVLDRFTTQMGEEATRAFFGPVESWGRWFGLDPQKMSNIITFGTPDNARLPVSSMNAVIENSYDIVGLKSQIQPEGATPLDETYRGFELYRMSGFTVAINSGVVIRCQQTGGISGRSLAKRVIETRDGDFPNYFDSLSFYSKARRSMGNVHVGRIVTHDPRDDRNVGEGVFPRAITDGFRWQFSRSAARGKLVTLFSKPEDADRELVIEFAASTSQLSNSEYTVTSEGNLVELTVSLPYDQLTGDVPFPPAFA